MSNTIYLRKLNPSELSPLKTLYAYKINNIDDLSFNYNSPVTPTPIPMAADTENILIKLEGNSTEIDISWLIKLDTTGSCYDYSPVPPSLPLAPDTTRLSIWTQHDFLQSYFSPVGFEESFDLVIDEDDTQLNAGELDDFAAAGSNGDWRFRANGTISKLMFRFTSNETTVMRASCSFMKGAINGTVYGFDTPSIPKNLAGVYTAASGGTPNKIVLTWTTPINNGSAAITNYDIKCTGKTTQRKGAAGRDCTFDNLTVGQTKTIQVYAINSNGNGAIATIYIDVPTP